MTILLIIGWIIGIVLVTLGCYWLPFLRQCEPIIEKEIELMRDHGKFEGEEEFMKEFRVAESEWDQIANKRNIKLCKAAITLGTFILSVLIIRAIFF